MDILKKKTHFDLKLYQLPIITDKSKNREKNGLRLKLKKSIIDLVIFS